MEIDDPTDNGVQSAADKPYKYPSLFKSKALRSLLRMAKEDRQDHRSLLLLLILINAHPKLSAHFRIFENLAILARCPPVLEYLKVNPNDAQQIRIWEDICHWVIENKPQFATDPDLVEFDYNTPIAGIGTASHPLNRNHQGFTRNSVCSCLFNRHESRALYDTIPEPDTPAFHYLCLQAQLLVSFMQCRMNQGNLVTMLRYTGKDEFPAEPVSPYSVSVAIRHLNHDRYSALLLKLNPCTSFEDFNFRLKSPEFLASVVQGIIEEDELQLRYLSYIEKYFNALGRYLHGIYKKRQRGKGIAPKPHRFSGTKTGFIHLDSGIWIEVPEIHEDDEDIPGNVGQEIQICDTKNDADGKEAERTGLSPEESRNFVLKLYHPDEMGGAMMQAKYAEMAKKMSAQRFAWDYETLTSTELRKLWELINQQITHAVNSNVRWSQQTSNEVQCSIIIKVMLILGQGLETVRNLQISRVGVTHHEGLVFHPPSAQSTGWWQLPSISPKYQTSFPKDKMPLGRKKGKYIHLPDLANIGDDISTYLTRTNRTLDRVFSVEPQTAKQGINSLLDELKEKWIIPHPKGNVLQVKPIEQTNKRITLSKIRNALGVKLRFISGDAAVEWITSANQDRKNETRLHYTNLSEQKVIAVYSTAVKSLMRDLGVSFKHSNAVTSHRDIFHGARFVASMESIKRLVTNLSIELSKKPLRSDRDDMIRYHNAYTFHVWLMQALYTSYRAVNNPEELIKGQLKNWNSKFGGLSDKENPKFADKARLVHIPEPLLLQLNEYLFHLQKISRKFEIEMEIADAKKDVISFIYLDNNGQSCPVTCSWCEKMMGSFHVPLPGNFHRAFLRTELIERGCPGQIVDAFLGHANTGESPFYRFSSLDYQLWVAQIESSLFTIVNEVGLTFQRSLMIKK